MSSQTPLLRVIREHTPVVYPCGAIVKCGFRSSDCLSLAGGLRQRELRAQSGRRVALDDDRWRRRRRRRPHRATESPRLASSQSTDQTRPRPAATTMDFIESRIHRHTRPCPALPCCCRVHRCHMARLSRAAKFQQQPVLSNHRRDVGS